MTLHSRDLVETYFRRDAKFPVVWCPGCGNGIIVGSLLRAIGATGISKDEVALVSGIGCSSRISTYFDFKSLHTAHGRALTFAAGVKLGNPSLNVIVAMGDGDAMAIGGNHFIHACRRNLDMTAIVFNNYTYGMTGGQASPTAPLGSRATTAPEGSWEQPFDIAGMAAAAGAAYVARTTVYHAAQMDRIIENAIRKKGFSVVEVLVTCPTIFGRRNRLGGPAEMINLLKEVTVPVAKAAGMSPEELAGKYVVGELVDRDRPAYARPSVGRKEGGSGE
jgi:2-oxoglutarate ferredoxin oxidoreductase subunit beta